MNLEGRRIDADPAPKPRIDALAPCFHNMDLGGMFAVPDCEGIQPDHTSPPKDPMYFADFCARMIERCAPGRVQAAVA
jgi:hypothetical protein